MNIEEIVEFGKEISHLFVGNTKRKNYFLAVCRSFDKKVDLDEINREVPFGGLIGVDDSKLERDFSNGQKFFVYMPHFMMQRDT